MTELANIPATKPAKLIAYRVRFADGSCHRVDEFTAQQAYRAAVKAYASANRMGRAARVPAVIGIDILTSTWL